MKRTILFSAGYLSVPAIVLLTEAKLPCERVAICVEGINLYKLFCYMNVKFWNSQVEIIYYPLSVRSGGVFGKWLATVRRLRSVYNLFFRDMSGCEVILFVRNYITDNLYYINRLRRSNKVILMDILSAESNGRQVPFWSLPHKEKLYYLYYRAIYGQGIELNNLAGTLIPHLNDNFIGRYVETTEFPKEQAAAVFAKYQKEFTAYCDMIFFDQNIDTYLTEEKEQFFAGLNRFFATMFNNRFAVKNHPEATTGTMDPGGAANTLPQFFPGEFFLNNQCKFFITYFSATLLSFPDTVSGKRIFLLDMLPFADENSRREIKQILLKSAGSAPIYFPKNFSELATILEGGELCSVQSSD